MPHIASHVTYSASCLQPKWVTPGHPRGTRALGLRFERAFAKAVPKAIHGQWFQYIDESGPNWCQPDFLLISKHKVIVIEVKLTDFTGACAQIKQLYIPVLQAAYPDHQISGLVVLRHLSRVADSTPVHTTLIDALVSSESLPLIHWLGRGHI